MWEGGAEEFPASLFPGLCKGLIKYGWCLEQSRGKWDSTNSTSSPGRPILLRWSPAVFFASSVSPSSSSPPSTRFTFHSLPFPTSFISSFPTFLSVVTCVYPSAALMRKCVFFSPLGLSVLVFSIRSFSLSFLCSSSSSLCFLLSSLLYTISSLPHTPFSLPFCDDDCVV